MAIDQLSIVLNHPHAAVWSIQPANTLTLTLTLTLTGTLVRWCVGALVLALLRLADGRTQTSKSLSCHSTNARRSSSGTNASRCAHLCLISTIPTCTCACYLHTHLRGSLWLNHFPNLRLLCYDVACYALLMLRCEQMVQTMFDKYARRDERSPAGAMGRKELSQLSKDSGSARIDSVRVCGRLRATCCNQCFSFLST